MIILKINKTSYLLLIAGTLMGIFTFFYFLLITSDIPVSYSIKESLYFHAFLFTSTFTIICGSILVSNKKVNFSLISYFVIILFMSLLLFNQVKNAEYFSSSYAQMIFSFVFHSILIVLINILLAFKKPSM